MALHLGSIFCEVLKKPVCNLSFSLLNDSSRQIANYTFHHVKYTSLYKRQALLYKTQSQVDTCKT